MTDEELTEIERLANAATPGPWREGSVETYNVFTECHDAECLGIERVLLTMNTHFEYEADARFIAAARAAVPSLVAEVRRLRREAHCPDCGSNIERHIAPVRAERDALAVEVERLKAIQLTPLEKGLLKEIRFGLHKYGRVDVETEHIDVLDKLIAAHGAKP